MFQRCNPLVRFQRLLRQCAELVRVHLHNLLCNQKGRASVSSCYQEHDPAPHIPLAAQCYATAPFDSPSELANLGSAIQYKRCRLIRSAGSKKTRVSVLIAIAENLRADSRSTAFYRLLCWYPWNPVPVMLHLSRSGQLRYGRRFPRKHGYWPEQSNFRRRERGNRFYNSLLPGHSTRPLGDSRRPQ